MDSETIKLLIENSYNILLGLAAVIGSCSGIVAAILAYFAKTKVEEVGALQMKQSKANSVKLDQSMQQNERIIEQVEQSK